MKKPIPLDRDAVIVRRVDEARRRRGLPKLRYSTPFISLGCPRSSQHPLTLGYPDPNVFFFSATMAALTAVHVAHRPRWLPTVAAKAFALIFCPELLLMFWHHAPSMHRAGH